MALSKYCRLRYTVAGSPLIRDTGHLHFGGSVLVFVEAAQVQPAADGVQAHRVVGRVVSRQPRDDAPDGFRRLIADLDGAAERSCTSSVMLRQLGYVPSICLVDERPAAAFQLDVPAFVFGGWLHGELPLAILDESAPPDETVIGD